MKERLTAVVGARIGEFTRKMTETRQAIKSLPEAATTALRLSSGSYLAKLAVAKSALQSMDDRHTVTLALKTNAFMRRLKTAKREAREAPSQISAAWSKMTRNVRGAMRRIANHIEDVQFLIGNVFRGALISSFSMISPLSASAVAAFNAIGAAVGVAGGGLLGLASSMTTAAAATGGLAAVAVPTFLDLRNGFSAVQNGNKTLSQFSTEMQSAIKAMQNLKTRHDQLVQATKPEVALAFSQAIKAGDSALKQMTPGIKSVATAFKGLMTDLNNTIRNANDMRAAFDLFNNRAAPAFRNWVTIAGNVLRGFINLMVAFDPLAQSMESGLLGLTERWAEWTREIQNSEGLERFINYVKANGPKLINIVTNITMGFVELFKAFAPMSADMLTGLEQLTAKFRAWASQFSKTQEFKNFINFIRTTGPVVIDLIGNLYKFIENLLIGMAPLGAAALEVANNFFSWANSMMKANPQIGLIIGAVTTLYGAYRLLSPVISITITALSGFVGVLGRILAPLGTVAKLIGTGLSTAMSGIIPLASRLGSGILFLVKNFGRLAGPIGIAISLIISLATAIYNNWGQIKATTARVWNSVRNVIMQAVQGVANFVQRILTQITTWWRQNSANIKKVANGLSTALQFIWNNIVVKILNHVGRLFSGAQQMFVSGMKILGDVFRGGWQALQGIVRGAWTIITSLISGALDIVLGAVGGFIALLTGDWKGLWQNMQRQARGFGTIFTGILTGLFRAVKGIFRGAFTVISSIVRNGWNIVKTLFDTAISFITGGLIQNGFSRMVKWIGNYMQQTWNLIKQGWSLVMNFLGGINLGPVGQFIMNTLVQGLISVIPGLNETTIQIGKTVINGFKNFFSGGQSKQEGKKAGQDVAQGLDSTKPQNKQSGKNVGNGAMSGITEMFSGGKSKQEGKSGGQDFSFGIDSMTGQTKTSGMNLGQSGVSGMTSGFGNQPQQLGRQAGMGVRDGLQPWIHPTRQMGNEIASASITGADTVFQGSLAMQNLSKTAASGLPQGLQSQTSPVNSTSKGLADGSLTSMETTFGGSTQMNNIGSNAASGLDQGLFSQQGAIQNTSSGLANSATTSTESAFGGTQAMQSIGSQAGGGLDQGLFSQNTAVGNTGASLATNATDSTSSAFGGGSEMNAVGYTAGAGLDEGLLLQMTTIKLTAENLANRVVDRVSDILGGPGPKIAGRSAGDGLRNGILARRGSVIAAARSVARSADNALRAELDINSPSRVTMTSGNHTTDGFARGIAAQGSEVERQATKVASLAQKGMEKANTAQMPNVQAAGAEVAFSTDDNELARVQSAINQNIGADANIKPTRMTNDVRNYEAPEQTTEVHNEIVGDEIKTTVNKKNAKESRIRDSFHGRG